MTGHRKFVVEGSETDYLCIELIDEAHSTVMIPMDSVQKRGLREASGSFELVREVMFKEPHELADDHRSRKANIRSRIDEGGLRQIIQELRDLYWREYSAHLTNTDKKLRASLNQRLLQELAVTYKLSKLRIRERLNQIIDAAMQDHAQNIA